MTRVAAWTCTDAANGREHQDPSLSCSMGRTISCRWSAQCFQRGPRLSYGLISSSQQTPRVVSCLGPRLSSGGANACPLLRPVRQGKPPWAPLSPKSSATVVLFVVVSLSLSVVAMIIIIVTITYRTPAWQPDPAQVNSENSLQTETVKYILELVPPCVKPGARSSHKPIAICCYSLSTSEALIDLRMIRYPRGA